jgi:hypothetical protein
MIKLKQKIKAMNFETEYQLKEFEAIKSEYFDEDGELWGMIDASNPTSKRIMERMLKLINQLKTELPSRITCWKCGEVFWSSENPKYCDKCK